MLHAKSKSGVRLVTTGLLIVLVQFGCSRSGDNVAPTRPLEVGSLFDVRAKQVLVYEDGGRCSPPQRDVRAGSEPSTCIDMDNVGQAEIPRGTILWRLRVNGRTVASDTQFGNSTPMAPGREDRYIFPARFESTTYFDPREPGEYEVGLEVWLRGRLGETNLENNKVTEMVTVNE